VHRFFKRGEKRFGYQSLFWATVAYLLRIFVPAFVIVREQLLVQGITYFGILTFFWFVHLRITGCPNCINETCPLNPDYVRISNE
jgi:hypothetical protein